VASFLYFFTSKPIREMKAIEKTTGLAAMPVPGHTFCHAPKPGNFFEINTTFNHHFFSVTIFVKTISEALSPFHAM
jgi:hypothetical protein